MKVRSVANVFTAKFWSFYNDISVTSKSVDCGKVVNLVSMITLKTHQKIIHLLKSVQNDAEVIGTILCSMYSS